MQRTSRSNAARDAGLWALDVLEDYLGHDWLGRYETSNGEVPGFLRHASSHGAALVDLLEWAARIETVRAVPGAASLRRPLQRDLAHHRLLHGGLQMEVASLALTVLGPPAFETRMASAAPVDIVIPGRQGPMPIEAFVLMVDDQMRAGFEADDEIGEQMMRIRFEYDVEFDGELRAPLLHEDLKPWIDRLEAAARSVAATGDPAEVIDHDSSLRVVAGKFVADAQFAGPSRRGRGWPRTEQRLRNKAMQALASGARWLRVDMRDGMWQFSSWSGLPFAGRVDNIAAAVVAAIDGLGLDGVVVSSGTCHVQGLYAGVSRPAGGHLGLGRSLDMFRARETVVLPVSARGLAEAPTWHELYEAEPFWLDEALARAGHEPLSSIFTN